MKITVTKEFTFDCAHMLSNHEGICSNLHGHTYKLEVTASAELIKEGSSQGMVVDFGDLKSIVKELIVDKFDHSFIFWEGGSEAEREIARVVEVYGMRIVKFNERPTAENMAIFIIKTLNEHLKDSPVKIVKVRLYETPTSFAEVEDDV
ncbi:6-carboxytetrahydropterin synthase QueD [Caloramator australicus]|uniref:6-carboxy-5,6,7,8-tetrahydropterin synthase n=1 Tax=Caloramator australicus RC3 TaxID=857293 RepID=I7K941_9CLOT|nr:6-carboxytetrahydropterin synthase QueD [Caloramator australicus]CCJ34110.1 Queuosine biosynthesis QueD, PTPS-I [Caloramator australicus RC3]